MEWLAVPSCRGSSPPRNWNCVSCISGRFFTTEPSVPSLAKSNSPLSYRCAHRAKRGLWKQNQEYRSHFKSKTMELTCTLTLSGNCSSFPSSALSSSLFCTFSHFSLPTPGLPPSPRSHYHTFLKIMQSHTKRHCVRFHHWPAPEPVFSSCPPMTKDEGSHASGWGWAPHWHRRSYFLSAAKRQQAPHNSLLSAVLSVSPTLLELSQLHKNTVISCVLKNSSLDFTLFCNVCSMFLLSFSVKLFERAVSAPSSSHFLFTVLSLLPVLVTVGSNHLLSPVVQFAFLARHLSTI